MLVELWSWIQEEAADHPREHDCNPVPGWCSVSHCSYNILVSLGIVAKLLYFIRQHDVIIIYQPLARCFLSISWPLVIYVLSSLPANKNFLVQITDMSIVEPKDPPSTPLMTAHMSWSWSPTAHGCVTWYTPCDITPSLGGCLHMGAHLCFMNLKALIVNSHTSASPSDIIVLWELGGCRYRSVHIEASVFPGSSSPLTPRLQHRKYKTTQTHCWGTFSTTLLSFFLIIDLLYLNVMVHL